ncbi:MAG TPA: lysine--tRNA ligase [Candidatus Woesebacteria bacterium]|nr:lysine--tRNA ligase [Candidatus Woesebacteria bacterium]
MDYPQPNLPNKNTCLQAKDMIDREVVLAGRIMAKRGHGRLVFYDLVDESGKIQLFCLEIEPNLKIGDIAACSGTVFKTQAGEISVKVKKLELLAPIVRSLPEKWHGLKDVEERYRKRYLDLIANPEVKEVFRARTKILTEIRNFLNNHGFMEVETPVLQPIYGGASAKPFITRHHELAEDRYLRISSELYLKRLIVGGFEKIYEVSRDFRNEGVSRFHNPEFTQIEFYWAYVDYEELMKFTQELINYVLTKVENKSGFDFTKIKKITFHDAVLKETGIDTDKITEKDLKIDGIGLGAKLDNLYKEKVRPKIIEPTFVVDYPSEMIALAKRKENNSKYIASFQLLVNGVELLKAYNELNDPVEQAARWNDETALAKKGAENAMQFDQDYIQALEYGLPPVAGWGMGIDRFVQIITNQPCIKDVIFFPAMRSEEI